MNLLLDTHIFLWLISGDARLPISTRDAIQNPENDVYLSVVSVWECIVKHQLGKLLLPRPPEEYLLQQRARHGIETLPLDEESVAKLPQLPSLHRDPFDRMLVCQALHREMTLVTHDAAIRAYPVTTLS